MKIRKRYSEFHSLPAQTLSSFDISALAFLPKIVSGNVMSHLGSFCLYRRDFITVISEEDRNYFPIHSERELSSANCCMLMTTLAAYWYRQLNLVDPNVPEGGSSSVIADLINLAEQDQLPRILVIGTHLLIGIEFLSTLLLPRG
ncbi:hypothetical protein CDAR_237091 [Caerostris darwini]|uniref:Uncharacterized protein n=1 Tax=Caerostris darwini TaxID=1538125 RepID=A0AAV4W3B7_9ARAC|nr:hypothetical protein CDAR_237091 [Caerostris darwini]